jgi:hypothetical protein
VGALALQEHGPYSARDEDEMIELVDLMHAQIHYYYDKLGKLTGDVVYGDRRYRARRLSR